MKFNSRKAALFASLFSLFLILILNLIQPVREKNFTRNFKDYRTRKLFDIGAKANALIKKEENFVLEKLTRLKNGLKNSLVRGEFFFNNNFYIPFENNKLFSFALWQKDSLIAWENNPDLRFDFVNNYLPGEVYFENQPLKASIAAYDTLKFNGMIYFIKLSRTVEKFYKLENDYFQPVSLNKKFTDLLNVETNLIYNSAAMPSANPNIYSFVIYNNYHNKIGLLNFARPQLKFELKELRAQTAKIISVLYLLFFVFIVLWIYPAFKKSSYLLRTVIVFIGLTLFRYLLYYVNVVDYFFKGDLTAPQYFSSRFGAGITSNPLELFITILLGFIFSLVALNYFFRSVGLKKYNLGKANIIILILLPIVLPFYFRGYAASIQSFIFSSSLQYFTRLSLFPGGIKLFLLFNLFLLGVAFFNLLLLFVFYFIRVMSKLLNKGGKYSSIFAGVILIVGFTFFNLIYNHLLLPYYLKLLMLLITLSSGYFIIKKDNLNWWSYLYLLIYSSVFSLLILMYFNKNYKKSSIKLAAREMLRPRVNLYKFRLKQLLVDIQKNENVNLLFSGKGNAYAEAFKIWTLSPFQKDNVPIEIQFRDSSNKIFGSYSYKIDISKNLEDKILTNVNNKKYLTVKQKGDKLIGSLLIRNNNRLKGKVIVNVKLHSGYVSGEPEFIKSRRLLNKIRVKEKDIFAFEIVKDSLKIILGRVEFPEKTIARFEKAINNKMEIWLETKVNLNDYLIYLFADKLTGKRIIRAVGLKESGFSLNWFYFVKLFFFHSLIILTIILIAFLLKVIKNKKLNLNFRFRLNAAFLIVALIPLVFLASYLRNLTQTKNNNSIKENLAARSKQTISYITKHWGEDNPFTILENASRDLGVNYSIFFNNSLVYSSYGKYYNITLLDSLLNFGAKISFEKLGLSKLLLKDKIENLKYSAFFRAFKINNLPFILEVNTAFNPIILPISLSDFDVFLFGIYSIAIIITLLISAILANQISNPIHKLTRATISVGQGDLNFRLQGKYYGEIGELIKGFNLMVEKLKENQKELSRMEREVTWREMAKQIAHEIKNPLTPMKLNVQHLKAAFEDGAEGFGELLSSITDNLIKQIETLRNIADEFSKFARLPGAKLTDVNLTRIIFDVTELYRDENLEIVHNLENPVNIKGDANNLRRALINIVRNSIQANATRISFNLLEDEKRILLDIKDNGTGIDGSIKEKIFEHHFSTKKEGTGMGLVIVKNILSEMNASIKLLETSPDGTTFRIIFFKES